MPVVCQKSAELKCQLLFGSFRGRFQSRQSLLVSGEFPVPAIREHAGRNPEKRPNHGSSLAGVSQFRCISLHLPSKSGICAQRRVRYRLHAPPFSLQLQRFRAHTREWPQKFARFRGVLAVGLSRIRTGDAGFEAAKAQQSPFFSVAKFGGSDSLLIVDRTYKLRFRSMSEYGRYVKCPARASKLLSSLPEQSTLPMWLLGVVGC